MAQLVVPMPWLFRRQQEQLVQLQEPQLVKLQQPQLAHQLLYLFY